MREEELERVARQAAQHVVASANKSQEFLRDLAIIIGVCGTICGALFYVLRLEIDAQIDRRVTPIEFRLIRAEEKLDNIGKSLKRIEEALKVR